MRQVTAINLYPVKSCRGVAVDEALVQARGLCGDRRFMLIDANRRFLTQRQHPNMANISARYDGIDLVIDAPGHAQLSLPATPEFAESVVVKIWRGRTEAGLAPGSINDWFSAVMGFPCALVYMSDDQHRAVPHQSADFDDEVGFADAAPLLLLSDASLEDLNARLDRAVTMRNFRPNVVVSAAYPYEEDDWQAVQIGDVQLRVAWPCARCQMVTVDPDSGARDIDGEPLATLGSYRREGGRILFGQNVIPRRFGRVRIGDAVRILA